MCPRGEVGPEDTQRGHLRKMLGPTGGFSSCQSCSKTLILFLE